MLILLLVSVPRLRPHRLRPAAPGAAAGTPVAGAAVTVPPPAAASVPEGAAESIHPGSAAQQALGQRRGTAATGSQG
jgi:hypothetical protein